MLLDEVSCLHVERNRLVGASYLGIEDEVETFFEVMEVPEDRRVPLVAYKLKGGAGAWCHRVQEERRLRGEPRVRTW